MPEYRTRESVELARVGSFDLSTGPMTFTREHLASAAEKAMRSPMAPRIKLGHTDPRFDGEPAIGTVKNLRLAEDGDVLLGDLTGIPAWLDDALDSSYPGRSIEAAVKGQDMTLTAVALLGATRPGIDTLADLEVALAASAAADPNTVVHVAAALGALNASTTVRPQEGDDRAEVPRPTNDTQEEGSIMDAKKLRAEIGLAEDASDEDVTAKLAELTARPEQDAVTTQVEEAVAAAKAEAEQEKAEAIAAAGMPDGFVPIEKSLLEDMKTRFARQDEEEAVSVLASATKDRAITPAQRDKFAAQIKERPEQRGQVLEFVQSLPTGVVPGGEIGGDAPEDIAASAQDGIEDEKYRQYMKDHYGLEVA